MGVSVPLVGDFHYIGHKLLADHPACAEALDKYRINPGNVGFKDKKDRQFSAIVEMAIRHGKAVRDRKSTRLNSSHANISYAVFCLKKNNAEIDASYLQTG